ncbi:gustatory receptor 5a for trehalose-like [Frankliniella occidentalis]|uniref:Gustatory receptor 5a for trehalose-like n=1 Tax=Frankliniella occidentalis TaxID=133901 RepID=A0A9C6U998_FRAOC|nr:gustatory receptor 5a for trehalose-like [Frankliniella occidentalis]
MLRSAAVVLSASCIPEESKAVKRVLYAVPTKQYSEEVQRFLTQVTTDEIALTGLGLFSITRSFILTMLGTIATYEILLVQMYRTSGSEQLPLC